MLVKSTRDKIARTKAQDLKDRFAKAVKKAYPGIKDSSRASRLTSQNKFSLDSFKYALDRKAHRKNIGMSKKDYFKKFGTTFSKDWERMRTGKKTYY
tara:strand:+ start:178 stop:468 length:291 start_codon:yes stop_codon:yes gene_type:complete